MSARLDLAGAARRVGFTLTPAELAGLDPHAHAVAVATWRGRMINEHASARGDVGADAAFSPNCGYFVECVTAGNVV